MSVLPLEEAATDETDELSVPEPRAALTVTDGDEARFVIVLATSERSAACQVAAPVVAVAVAPGPPLPVLP